MTHRAPRPELRSYRVDRGAISVRFWRNPGAPLLVFAHATGFCASAYDQMLGPLSDRFEIVAPDLRGHGRTSLPADPATHRSWDVYASDLLALCAQLPARPQLMAGHSMGAVCVLLAASRMTQAPVLALVEPVVMPFGISLAARWPWPNLMKGRVELADRARRRADRWPDRAAALERYSRHKAFAAWAPGVLEDYLADGLAEDGSGVYLACDPQWEAAIYEAHGHDILRAARRVGDRAHVLKVAHDSTVLNQAGLSRRGFSIDQIEGVGHLAPMEAPVRVAAWISGIAKTALSSQGS